MTDLTASVRLLRERVVGGSRAQFGQQARNRRVDGGGVGLGCLAAR